MTDQIQSMLGRNSDHHEIISRIRTLSEEVWEDSVSGPDIDRWLQNFNGAILSVEAERLNALHLLAHFNYFGLREIRELLKSVYRDLFRYPIIQNIRKANNSTRDFAFLDSEFKKELEATRFLGMGNPSESGAHLLYYFRQENGLAKRYFIHQHEILDKPPGDPEARLAIAGLRRLVFVDDLLGSGTQATDYSNKLLQSVKAAAERDGVELEVCYYTLFAKPEGLSLARSQAGFDSVKAVHEIDATQNAFDLNSRVYARSVPGVSLLQGVQLAAGYGERLFPGHGLGYRNGQLLLGLHHNVPDNTLPIFWFDETAIEWSPVFPRYNKVYS